MGVVHFVVLLTFLATIIKASSLISSKPVSHFKPECSAGIAFWCQNITNAKKCNAVDACISNVWETNRVQLDSNVICDDCKEWVGKARSFIEKEDRSGDVVRSLKWTCDLIPVASLATSCEKVVDENVPEIFKMLESKMDPDAVCTKLYFCKNAQYDQALEDQSLSKQRLLPFTCGQCHHIGAIVEEKFAAADRDDVLESLLSVCGELSSLSDACSSLTMMHFDDIYNTLQRELKTNKLCKEIDACELHQKEGIVDIIPPHDEADPNIPCELCEQLVLHLRELLIANTTEIEFKKVMQGFCHQMGKFSDECISIADQYYDIIYRSLVDKLNANKACILIGICPSQGKLQAPTMPLLASDIYPTPYESGSKLIEVHIESEDSSIALHKNGSWCATCNYFIHYLQEALRKQSTEDDIVKLMKETCTKLPQKIQHECGALVDLYGDAMMSFLDQGMDPRYICPKIKMCPPNLDLEYLQETAVDEKPTCPFCLLALQEVHDVIESNRTKQNIENVLAKLCSHLSDKLLNQCTEFVKKYSEEIVEMVLADFTPQEACTFIKLCNDSKIDHKNTKIVVDDFSDDFDDFSEEKEILMNPQCELCKEIVKIVEQRVINKKSKDEIRRELEASCSRLKKLSDKCKHFVDKYSDLIVDLIAKELAPQEVCRQLIFCVNADDAELQDYDAGLDILIMAERQPDEAIMEQPQCVICEFVMMKLESELNDTKVDSEIKNAVRNVCSKMPASVAKSCQQFVDYYFDMIIVFIETMKPSEVCSEMKLCPKPSYDEVMTGELQHDVYKCAICKGFVEGLNSVVEDPYTDTNLENLEEKLCQKFAGKYRPRCHDIATTYGLAIINLLKTMTDSDQICYKMNLCSWSGADGVTGMLKLT